MTLQALEMSAKNAPASFYRQSGHRLVSFAQEAPRSCHPRINRCQNTVWSCFDVPPVFVPEYTRTCSKGKVACLSLSRRPDTHVQLVSRRHVYFLHTKHPKAQISMLLSHCFFCKISGARKAEGVTGDPPQLSTLLATQDQHPIVNLWWHVLTSAEIPKLQYQFRMRYVT